MPLTDHLEAAVGRLLADVYVSHDGLAERADELAADAEAAGDRRNADLARLVRAELHNRSGRVDEGVAHARHILGTSNDRLVRAHAYAVIAGGLWRIGDNGTAVRHALRATRMLSVGDPLPMRADHAIILAVQVNDQRAGGISHEEFETAQALAEASEAPALVIANLNNWAWCTYSAGDLDGAGRLVERMRDYSAATGVPLNVSSADTVGRILFETGRHAEAERVMAYAIDGAATTDSDAVPAALITLAEIQRYNGDLPAAMATLARCRELAARDDLPDVAADALRMVAACQAGVGDFRAAYETMVEFHEAWVERRSEQSDIAARVAHAQFAVDEAYRDTERYREMAERDPLTGLWNRRRSDAEIAAVLAKGRPACVALVDLDHFKLINDTFSHAVGDDVLRQVADVLRMAFGQAGRQGGEEFIVVLPGGLEDGRMACERVRQRLEAHPWDTIAPGLRVTASIGVSPFVKGEEASSAISRADALLYAAKRGGRNRVEAG